MALLVLLLLVVLAGAARSDLAMDRDECASTLALAGLATCLSYVQGSAAVPTPDCCTGLKGVLAKNPKCLCVLIKDRDDPSLGVHINLTRALTLPDTCKAVANISHCPELLNLPPNSPDAQVFKNLSRCRRGKIGGVIEKIVPIGGEPQASQIKFCFSFSVELGREILVEICVIIS